MSRREIEWIFGKWEFVSSKPSWNSIWLKLYSSWCHEDFLMEYSMLCLWKLIFIQVDNQKVDCLKLFIQLDLLFWLATFHVLFKTHRQADWWSDGPVYWPVTSWWRHGVRRCWYRTSWRYLKNHNLVGAYSSILPKIPKRFGTPLKPMIAFLKTILVKLVFTYLPCSSQMTFWLLQVA